MPAPVIDFRVSCPVPEGLDRYLKPEGRFADYARHYGSRVYGEEGGYGYMEPAEFIAFLDEQGVDKALIKASDMTTISGVKFPADVLHEYVREHPDRLIGTAGCDPFRGMDAVRDLERDVRDYGLRGVNMGPWELGLYANDKKFYPVYAKCVELDIPVLLHTSMNLSSSNLLDFGRPIYLDEVARDFPELRIVAVHGGWPWIAEMIAVCWRHPNLYIEISGTMPAYIGAPGSGWEPLIRYGNSVLKDKILWASNWPMISPKESLAEFDKFPLKDDVKERWFGGNALKALALEA